MNRQQLAALCVNSLIGWGIGSGLLPILPLFATSLGATPTMIGYYMAVAYVAMAGGALSAGWLAARLKSYKKTLILAGAICAPALVGMGQATVLWMLVVCTMLMWYWLGMLGSLVNILIGLDAKGSERGRIFGIVLLAGPIGTTMGGALSGAMVDWAGYPTLFWTFAVTMLITPLVNGLALADRPTSQSSTGTGPAPRQTGLGQPFVIFCIVTVLASTTTFLGRLGMSLVMRDMGFSAALISGAVAVGSLIAVPFIPLTGTLSDRWGRKAVLVVMYILAGLGVLTLTGAGQAWQFWIAASLFSIAVFGSGSVASALATDLLPRETLNQGMSLFSSMTWIAAILGFALTGALLDLFGPTVVFLGATVLPALAALGLLLVHTAQIKPILQAQNADM